MEQKANKKTLKGTIVSDKMNSTAVVAVSRLVKHPLYGKYMKRTKKYSVHNPDNTYKKGEVVFIEESKPISKTKHFVIKSKV